MSRLFHVFPDGRTGLGLLLLRGTLGAAALIGGRADLVAGKWIFGCLAILAALALWIGFATPMAAVLAGLGGLLASGPPMVFMAAIAVSVVLLGPGAFSVDARLFGLREIIIPPRVSREALESQDRGMYH